MPERNFNRKIIKVLKSFFVVGFFGKKKILVSSEKYPKLNEKITSKIGGGRDGGLTNLKGNEK